MKKKLYNIIFVATSWLVLASCSSDFLKEYSQDLGRVQTVDDLKELVVGDCLLPKSLFSNEYSYFQTENDNYLCVHFMSDELQENINTAEDMSNYIGYRDKMFPYFTWQQNLYIDKNGKISYDSNESELWNLAYQVINNCNMVLDAADLLTTHSETEMAEVQKVKGELYYLRASYYLMLVNLYGKPYTPSTAATELAVPVKLSPNVEDKDFERASVADVYAQIISDLDAAEAHLATASAPVSIYHPGIEAVYILRSRVALYMQDWEIAKTYAQKAIDKDGYLLNLQSVPSASYPLNKQNVEVVFSNGASMLGNILFVNPGDKHSYSEVSPSWYLSDNLYALFSDDDYRKTTYITTDDDLTNSLPTYHKVDCSIASYGKYKEVSDVFSIRTAEAYLNMAEAEAQLGNDHEACVWLGKLRQNRIADGGAVTLAGAELIKFVREEREREFFLEGQRWFDLRRYMVDAKYPFTKEIVHTMSTFKSQNGTTYRSNLSKYRLEKNDAAYTLDIPKQVRDFQPSIGSNQRPVRPAFESEDFSAGGGDDGNDDYDW